MRVPHSIYAIAYRFDYANQSIVVTGDLTYSKTVATLAKNVGFLIIDSGDMVMTNKKVKSRVSKNNQPNNRKKLIDSKRVKTHLNLSESSLIARLAEKTIRAQSYLQMT
ncbi:MAG: hypothetical protein GY763_07990 [Gammaproteobacteria bacterium]|nr:hypothetical protein [Gammaproteobacteria bacterium]